MSRTDRVLRMLQTRGVRRGVFGSSRGWFWIAVVTWGLRRMRRMIGSEPEVVFRGELKPGHAIQIDHLTEIYGPPNKRRRRRRS
ncbi:MAG: hypothetical protein ACRD2C_01135 [Acidimicrobiales bacterium]